MRVFFAIALPADVRRKISEYVQTLKPVLPRMKWVEEENLHLTLRFIGEIGEEKLSLLSQAADRLPGQVEPFSIELGELGAFPKPGRARVLWWGLKRGQAEAGRIFARLEDELIKRGFKPERRSYHPHVTLARLRRPAPLPLNTLQPPAAISALVKGFVLIKSTLTPRGPIYRLAEEFRLG